MSVTKFRIRPEEVGKWEHQNRAEYAGPFVEGVLLDSYVLACKRGWCFVYARSAAAGWSSWHEYKFAAYKDDEACKQLWDEWYELERWAEEYEKQAEGSIA